MNDNASSLLPKWLATRRSSKLRTIDIAEQLGVSECELVASACGNKEEVAATRLSGPPLEVLGELEPVGRMKAITRNREAVLEIEGTYGKLEMFEHAGQVVGDIDLRVFPRRWRHVFCVREQTRHGERVSLQFFDDSGRAIHKSYATAETDREALEHLVSKKTSADQSAFETVAPPPAEPADRPDDVIDITGLRAAWRAMTDTHELFGILRRFEVGRLQALRLIGPELARPAAVRSLRETLEAVAAASVPIMIFVGNPSLIQIWSGPVRRIVTVDRWLNVLDPAVNLHVREDRIESAWVVRKPTSTGVVTALELYAGSDLAALLVGKRPHGEAENEAWRRIVSCVPENAA